ncbi:ras GTPase-activating protein 3-like isoform X3 [Haliotis rufescens]|uniref:ras GTPase-activating protein 3-like isoform X3 n=2 Tax=Haliotis rufescens TaxID=6454 RepID=UPI001EB0500E|nr:ras GTPase-activating protein 3-like isoform X3 [Haliotis rufescens]
MASLRDVRVEETLRVKIGEAKNLSTSSVSGSGRTTVCTIRIDSEEIYRTAPVEKTPNPFYGAEFHGDIPIKFRFLSFYVCDSGGKTEKVLGKVTLKKEELYKFYNKDHWFSLTPADLDAAVKGKINIEVRFDEYLSTEPESCPTHRMAVRVVECSNLTVINGACNPYVVVTLNPKSRHKEIRRTVVKKKTICPHYDETFFFDLENKGQNHDRKLYCFEDAFSGDLSISVWHDDSLVSREVLGNIFRGSFLGEVKIPLHGLDTNFPHSAWYSLQARESLRQTSANLGSLRLNISYTADYVFLSHYYNDLRSLLLHSIDVQPISCTSVYLLGEVVEHRQDAAQPLVRMFLKHGKIVPLVSALAKWEIEKTTDANTFFRGNTLVTKLIDELMKLVGLPYLHDTLKTIIDKIFEERKLCEVDPGRMKEGASLEESMGNLKEYVVSIVEAITGSALVCPTIMREVFHAVKEAAMMHYDGSPTIKYRVVSSFVFLRFFAPAILGPKLFDLRTDTADMLVHRTLTLVSKVIQGLVNLISSNSVPFNLKEEYMVPVFDCLSEDTHMDAVRMFLDIVSSRTGAYSKNIEAPIVLKEGVMIKRAQGRNKIGRKNFKRRYFCLTNQYLSYAKSKTEKPLCSIPIEDILAVERLQENSFKMNYMFQVVQPARALYIQANNCVEEKEWLDILTKVCNTNKNRLIVYHPAAFINGHWLCCKEVDLTARGCCPVSGGLPVTDIQLDIDSDREVEKIHSLFLGRMDKLDSVLDSMLNDIDNTEQCGCQEVYSGNDEPRPRLVIEDTKQCYQTVTEIQKCVINLEQEHKQHRKMLQKHAVPGSIDMPIGDESAMLPGTRL